MAKIPVETPDEQTKIDDILKSISPDFGPPTTPGPVEPALGTGGLPQVTPPAKPTVDSILQGLADSANELNQPGEPTAQSDMGLPFDPMKRSSVEDLREGARLAESAEFKRQYQAAKADEEARSKYPKDWSAGRDEFKNHFQSLDHRDIIGKMGDLLIKKANSSTTGEVLSAREMGYLEMAQEEAGNFGVASLKAGAAMGVVGAGTVAAGPVLAAKAGSFALKSLLYATVLDKPAEMTTRRLLFWKLGERDRTASEVHWSDLFDEHLGEAEHKKMLESPDSEKLQQRAVLDIKSKLKSQGREAPETPDELDRKVKRQSKEGLINHLLDQGYSWPAAFAIGLMGEIAIDPLMLSGVGMGQKVIAKGAAGSTGHQIAEEAAKAGSKLTAVPGVTKGTATQLGVFGRPIWKGKLKRELFGIPGSEKLTEPLGKIKYFEWVAKKFTPAGKASGAHMAHITKDFAEPKAGEAGYEMYQRGKAAWKELEKFRPTKMGKVKAALSSKPSTQLTQLEWNNAPNIIEHLGPAARGDPAALQAIKDLVTNPNQIEAALHMQKMIKAGGTTLESMTGETIPELHKALKSRLEKMVKTPEDLSTALEKIIYQKETSLIKSMGGAAKRAQGKAAGAGARGLKKARLEEQADELGRFFKDAGIPVERSALLDQIKGRAEMLAEEAAKPTEKWVAKAGQEGWDEAAKATERANFSAEINKRIDAAITTGQREGAQYTQQRIDELRKLAATKTATPKGYRLAASKMADELEGTLPTRKIPEPVVEGLSEAVAESAAEASKDIGKINIPKARWGSKTAREAMELSAEDAISEADEITKALLQAENLSPKEFKKVVKKLGGLKFSEQQRATSAQEAMHNLYARQAKLQKVSQLYKDILDGKITPAQAQKMMDSTNRVLKRAGKRAKDWIARVDYSPRIMPKGGVGEKNLGQVFKPEPLGKTAPFKDRTWLKSTGASMSLMEIENEVRSVLRDPTQKINHPNVTKTLRKIYNTTDTDKAIAMARKDIDKGKKISDKIFEADPDTMIWSHYANMSSEVGKSEIASRLGRYGSDVPTKYHDVPASELGPRMGARYPDKYFPQAIADEYHQWEKSVAELSNYMSTKGAIYKTAKTLNNIWKISVTGPRPGYQFRNAIDDLSRFFAEGAYNPLRLHVSGAKAMLGKGMIDTGKKNFGTISGEDFRVAARAFRVDEGGLMSEAIGKGRLGAVLNIPEQTRRLGLWAERMRGGMNPAEAAQSVKRVAFSSQNLAPWERSLRDTTIPFYSFQRQSLPWGVTQIAKNPAWVKANMSVFEAGKIGAERVNEAGLDILPDWMRDQAIHVVRGDFGTDVLSIPSATISDVGAVIDAAGEPIKAFQNVTHNWFESVRRQISPPIMAIGEAIMGSDKWSEEMDDLPLEFAKLPDPTLNFFGAKLIPSKDPAGNIIDKWVIPKRNLSAAKLVGVYSELKRYLKPKSLKKIKEGKWLEPSSWIITSLLKNNDSLRNMLTGISKTRVTDIEAEHRVYTEMNEVLEGTLEKAHMLDDNKNILPQYRPSGGDGGSEAYKLLKELRDRKEKAMNAIKEQRYLERKKNEE